ncbi:hypothetical protein QOL99_04495 [Deinococcus sp. MIMF12]|uniref:Uncharacterized protein n=1 Tax=Deinococcus rhizophilus TaxID=3049544 RepID=A0ABT7JED0_9DEIO|nr:hypothetical protein [Deinococcus rhizophilus]MDL2343409.1 hypothetical protein [Deinococcus rhizophilus]
MARSYPFWQLLGALDANPELDVTWDPALYDEPEAGQYWAYVYAGDRRVAKLSNAQPIAFVVLTAPPIVHALLAQQQIKVVRVVDLEHPTTDVTRFLQRALEQKHNWSPQDFDRLEHGLQELNLHRDWDDNEYVIITSNEQGQIVAVEHLYLPFALTFKITPIAFTALLQELQQHVLTIEDWATPNLSINAAAAPDLIERLPLFGVDEGDLEAFSAELLTYWMR